jgi:hypothetical protein
VWIFRSCLRAVAKRAASANLSHSGKTRQDGQGSEGRLEAVQLRISQNRRRRMQKAAAGVIVGQTFFCGALT